MAKKGSRPPRAPVAPERARAELSFDRPELLPLLFGQYDQNLIAIENRLGVAAFARGDRVALEGAPGDVARARDVLRALQVRLEAGMPVDLPDIDSAILMADEPHLAGLDLPADGPAPRIIRTRKKSIAPRTRAQALYMEALATHELIFALGPAGTGKTYVAVAQAVSQLITGSVDRLILSRPAVEAGERLGFLPGDMKEKVDPYLRPLVAVRSRVPSSSWTRRRTPRPPR